MNQVIFLYGGLVVSLITGAGFLHLLPRLGKKGQEISDWFCYAPGIDLALAYFMLIPIAIGLFTSGWQGLGIALLSELTTLWFWIIIHELTHKKQWHQAKIHRTMSHIAGTWQNHLAVWITTLAIPIFWTVRFGELFVYPPLTKLIKLPAYNEKEWVNVSRHKFEGLIGYDLIWCLYCDWMTGVWSLGTEMLRNVESFWCPIRFYDDKKCENCKIDFPDLESGWIASNGSMDDVEQLLKQKYSEQHHSWFGHPDRQH